MTIYQARYGSNAEIGRIPNRKPREEQSTRNLAAGVGLAGLGGGAYYAGKQLPVNALSRAKNDERMARGILDEYRAQRNLRNDLRGRIARRPGGPTITQQRNLLRAEADTLGAKNAFKAQNKARRANLASLARKTKLGGKLKVGGAIAGLAGLGLAGTSAYRTERARGTFGYKRPTMRGMSNEGM